jgi:anti-anti-sigma regulatory factor
MASFEVVNGLLFVTGSLDRSSDQEFKTALEQYMKATPVGSRVVDMSNVRWLAPTGAKELIAAGQDVQEKGGGLRVLASRHVLQTLNLLGAKTWLNIESCLSPNAKPGTEAAPAAPAEPAEAAEKPAATEARPAAAPAGETAAATAAPAPAAAPAQPSASGSGLMPAVGGARMQGAFVGPLEELSPGAQILRLLQPNRRYSFHLDSGELMLGVVRERVGGPWVIIESTGTRRILNLEKVTYCEIL